MTLLPWVLLFPTVIALVLLMLYFMTKLIFRLSAVGSGYAELARRFPAPHEPVGQKYTRQSIRIGAVRWRWSATLVFSPEGLYLAFMPGAPIYGDPGFSRFPPVLIPWSEIRSAARGTLYWRSAVTLTIGDPTIAQVTLWQAFFPLIEPYTAVRPAR
jgi:hypothetical protein